MNRNGIIFLSILILLIGLFGWQNFLELRSEEPRRAIVALEMLFTGEYVVPKINGWSYYNKPPLFNWVMVVFFFIFGTQEWVVRLPSLLSLILTAFLVYNISKKYISKESAIIGSLFFLTAGEVLFYGAVISGEIDFFYSLLVTAQALVIFHYFSRQKWILLFTVSYTLMALGFLTKGLPSLAFQFFTLIAVALTFKNYRFLLKWHHFVGIVLGLSIILGYLFIYNQYDDALGFLVRQTKEAGMRSSLESSFVSIVKEFFLFPLRFLKLLLPWSFFLLLINNSIISKIKQNPFLRFCFWFITCNILIYWFAGSFGHRYVYMFLPFACVLLSSLHFLNTGAIKSLLNVIFKWVIMLSPALLGLLFYMLPELSNLNSVPLKVLILFLLLSACIYSLIKFKKVLLSAILFLAIMRIGFNLFYLPILQETGRAMYYREECTELLKLTGDEQIFLYGDPYIFNSKTTIGPLEIDKKLTTAPLIPYKIPYYLTRSNKMILQFDVELKPDRFYLIPENKLSDQEVLFEIRDDWQKKKFFLIRT